MNKFEAIGEKTMQDGIEKGNFPTFDEYETKLAREALREGANPEKIKTVRGIAIDVWKSDGLSLKEMYGIIAALYNEIAKTK